MEREKEEKAVKAQLLKEQKEREKKEKQQLKGAEKLQREAMQIVKREQKEREKKEKQQLKEEKQLKTEIEKAQKQLQKTRKKQKKEVEKIKEKTEKEKKQEKEDIKRGGLIVKILNRLRAKGFKELTEKQMEKLEQKNIEYLKLLKEYIEMTDEKAKISISKLLEKGIEKLKKEVEEKEDIKTEPFEGIEKEAEIFTPPPPKEEEKEELKNIKNELQQLEKPASPTFSSLTVNTNRAIQGNTANPELKETIKKNIQDPENKRIITDGEMNDIIKQAGPEYNKILFKANKGIEKMKKENKNITLDNITNYPGEYIKQAMNRAKVTPEEEAAINQYKDIIKNIRKIYNPVYKTYEAFKDSKNYKKILEALYKKMNKELLKNKKYKIPEFI